MPDDEADEPPYKGLRYFDETDAHLFFGREALTTELVSHLTNHRFLAVIGASGSGKSSVVRAGLIPAVRGGAVTFQGQPSDGWPIHIITPSDEPLKALAATLTRHSESVTATKTLLAGLRSDTDTLDLHLYRQFTNSQSANQPATRLLLVVDQFEELFTQCDDEAERWLFVENLVQAVQSGKQGRLTLVLTLRADFYAQAVRYEGLVPLLENQQRIVEGMKPAELQQAMRKPLAGIPYDFQPGLVRTILQDVGREPGALPLLSHALLATWRRREGAALTLAGYQAAGGVRGAIAQTAERVYQALDAEKQQLTRNIFLRLTELGEGTEDTRRRTTLAELLPDSGTQREATQQLLAKLADERLVTTAEAQAEVAHEALIREWPRLSGWLDEDRDGLRLHRQLTEAAQAWADNEQDESYLYRGGRLEQVQGWCAKNEGMLSEQEQAFVATGLQAEAKAAEERERARQREEEAQQRELEQAQQLAKAETKRAQLLRWGFLTVATLLVVAIGAAIYIFGQANELARQGRVSLAQSVAALSLVVQNDVTNDQELATLLAIQAARLNQDEGGNAPWLLNETLRETLGQPYVFNQTRRGHEATVWSVAFAPDGQTLASASDDNTIRLWVLLDGLVEIGGEAVGRNLSWDEWQRYVGEQIPYEPTCPNRRVHPSVPSG